MKSAIPAILTVLGVNALIFGGMARVATTARGLTPADLTYRIARRMFTFESAVLVNDAAYMVTVPYFVPDVPPLIATPPHETTLDDLAGIAVAHQPGQRRRQPTLSALDLHVAAGRILDDAQRGAGGAGRHLGAGA